jgi:hypothetical protein
MRHVTANEIGNGFVHLFSDQQIGITALSRIQNDIQYHSSSVLETCLVSLNIDTIPSHFEQN